MTKQEFNLISDALEKCKRDIENSFDRLSRAIEIEEIERENNEQNPNN